MSKKKNKKKCTSCDGKGYFEFPADPKTHFDGRIKGECEMCHGSGIEIERKR